ncbi:hypothetical protein L227DRAFT_389659 [Lentinus tigrinus ALCF2SS1-6]|uniref:F-box domain-containing protein n=1 Tax=Lentinus tigrinus ALCF2SS1-6 TaxID=1328759 RepID=A0A5C2SHY5_9APHY|nr:hypothetical protein L227DRAFT_389659 [Lentinus tigrinus ALCF2SS1-6]
MTVDVWRQPKSFVAFFEFLRQNTNIAGYVKELHLAGAPSEEGYESGFDVETLVDILPMLTALHTLSIKYCVFRVPSCISLVPATDARFPFLLRKLVISDCASAEPTGYLDTFSDFLSLFCADTLQVGGLLFPDPPDNHRRDYEMVAWRPKRCISTHNLVILPGAFFMLRHAAFNIHEFFARLLPPGALSAISSSFHLVSPPMLSHFHDFLRSAAAQNIVSIDLHLVWIVKWFPQVEDFEAAGLALSGCQNLLYLRIDIPGFVSRRTEDPARRSLLSTILRLAPCTIQVLAFRMTRLWEVRFLELWDLPEIDSLLTPGSGSHPLFPLLRNVVLELECPRHKALEEAILSILPRLRASGLLQVISATAPLEQGVFLPAL